MRLRLSEIRDLAYRFVPCAAADSRLYRYGARSWWPAHEIGHFLVATPAECRQGLFGLDDYYTENPRPPKHRYAITKEIAAMAISQRLLRRGGHAEIADEEIEYTAEDTLECRRERWCRRAVEKLLRRNKVARLLTTRDRLEALLARKARAVGTRIHATRRAAIAAAEAAEETAAMEGAA